MADPSTARALDLQGALALFSLASGISITLSIIYNYGYFSTLGLFSAELLSPSDIFSSAIAWLPAAVASLALGGLLGSAIIAGEHFLNTRHGAPKKKLTLAQRLGVNKFTAIAVAAMLLFLLVTMNFPRWPAVLLFGSVMVFGPCAYMIADVKDWDLKFGIWRVIGVVTAVNVAVFAFFLGNSRAYSDLTIQDRGTLLIIQGSDRSATPAYALRLLDRGVLIKIKHSNEIRFVKWDVIQQMGAPYSTFDDRSLLCKYVGWQCETSH